MPLHPGKQSWRSTFPKAALGSSSCSCSPAKGQGVAPKGQALLNFPWESWGREETAEGTYLKLHFQEEVPTASDADGGG